MMSRLSSATARRRLRLGLALLLAPLAAQAADDCRLALGRGWPPATENHGSAVEQVLAAQAKPRLRLTQLPVRGVESGLMLIPGNGERADWTLRHATASERVAAWTRSRNGGALEMRLDQEVETDEAPLPAELGQRLVDAWSRTLAAAVPADRPAEFHDKDQLLFLVDGLRVSGLEPDCGPARRLLRQAELLTEAADESPAKRERRWRELAESLDELDRELAGNPE